MAIRNIVGSGGMIMMLCGCRFVRSFAPVPVARLRTAQRRYVRTQRDSAPFEGASKGKNPEQVKPKTISPGRAKSAREAAYLAALAASRSERFIADGLDDWVRVKKPPSSDVALATLVANAACREALSLDYALQKLAGDAVKLKAKHRILLRQALATYKYCTRTPVHAVVNPTVELAKHYGGGPSFGNFVNAVLRKLPQDNQADPAAQTRQLPLPEFDTSVETLSTLYSHPPFLVHKLVEQLGVDKAVEVMSANNAFPPLMARSRRAGEQGPAESTTDDSDNGACVELVPSTALPEALTLGGGDPLPYNVGIIRAPRRLSLLTSSDRWYVTNGTPAGLIGRLAQQLLRQLKELRPTAEPVRVLDLCSAPGGKALAVLDIFKSAGMEEGFEMVMNDVGLEKLAAIRENLDKFGLQEGPTRTVQVGDGREVERDGPGYDVVIVDAPCTNAGVLSRRPEARWRLADSLLLEQLMETQMALLRNSCKLIKPHGQIWYMTCSILRDEDEDLVARACEELGLEVMVGHSGQQLMIKVLPGEGPNGAFDGGFAAVLRIKQVQ